MATPDNHAPLESFERLALSLVGGRKYVRALELVSQIRKRFPNANLDFRFKRPLACDVLVTKSRHADWSTRVTVETAGQREDFFVINVNSEQVYRAEEGQNPPHIVVYFAEFEQRYVAFGSDEIKLMGLLFENYQKKTKVRSVVVSMRLMSVPKRYLRYVTVNLEPIKSHWIKARIFLNSQYWADVVWLKTNTPKV